MTEHQQQNMMNAENLAIVFAPTLLRSPETDPLFSLSAVKYERELIELLIINHSVLFIWSVGRNAWFRWSAERARDYVRVATVEKLIHVLQVKKVFVEGKLKNFICYLFW